jgi:hypothetical protein
MDGRCGAQTLQHSFADKLAFTRGIREATDTATILRLLPGCVSVTKTDNETDRCGVDFIADLRRGAKVLIDSKTREPGAAHWWRHDEPEFALEIWSVCAGGKYAMPDNKKKIGWTLNESTPVDMILYTFDPADSMEAFLIGFQPLRMAFRSYFHQWCKKYERKTQDSKTWESECVFVPASVCLAGIMRASRLTPIAHGWAT